MRRGPAARKMRAWRALGISACCIALSWLLAPAVLQDDAAQAQGTGAYVVADTWQSVAPVPADAWPSASGVAIDATGRIYVADAARARISVIETDGNIRLLDDGTADLGLIEPRDLAIDDARGRLYVADPGVQGVVVLGLDGSAVDVWRGIPAIAGVGVAPDGTVFAGDAESGEVQRFTPEGPSLTPIRAVPGSFAGARIRNIDVAQDGSLAVLDGRENRLLLWDGQGQRLDPIDLPRGANDVIADHNLGIVTRRWYWFTSDAGLMFHDPVRELWETNLQGRLSQMALRGSRGIAAIEPGSVGLSGASKVHLWAYSILDFNAPPIQSWGAPAEIAGRLEGPSQIQVGEDGLVYILDAAPRVQRFELTGQVLNQVEQIEPLAVDAGPDGNMYTVEEGELRARAANEALLWSRPLGSGLDVAGLAYEPISDEIAILDAEGGRILRYRSTGDPAGGSALPPAPAGGRRVWSDIAAAPRGALHVLDRGQSAVVIVQAGGGIEELPVGGQPTRLSLRADGLSLLLGRDGWVRGYDDQGLRQLAFDARRADLGPATRPADLSLDAEGDVYVADRRADVVTRWTWDPDAEPPQPPEAAGECRGQADKRAAPSPVNLGGTVTVTLHMDGLCDSRAASLPMDIFIMLDRSGSMRGEPMEIALDAALRFAEEADLSVSRVGVISFAGEARLETGLTGDLGRIRAALGGIVAGGGTRIDEGLALANREILRSGSLDAQWVYILLSDGDSDAASALAEADRAKAENVEIFTIGIQANAGLLRAVASSPDHYYGSQRFRELFGIFDRIAEQIEAPALFTLATVMDQIPDNMRLVPDSAQPPAEVLPGPPVTLRWRLEGVPFEGVDLRYSLEPQETGLHPTNLSAWTDYLDGYGRSGRLDFPVPEVEVIGPTPTPSPTASPSPTPSASATRHAGDRVLYLPLALNEQCKPDQEHVDVLLVLDTSLSMTGGKLDAARAAALSFVDLLRLPEDQVGLVTFNAEARVPAPLGSSRASIAQALAGLGTEPGTRIDLGLNAAFLQLLGAANPANQPAIVLLTDGVQQVAAAEALRAASDIRAAGASIYSIGLGGDVDVDFLGRLAGAPSRRYLAAGPEDLARIYADIAALIPCAGETFWGGR